MTVGFVTGWNIFYEQVQGTTQLETNPPGAITALTNRYINFVPVMLNAHYYMGERGKYRPYIGIADVTTDSWEWGIAPELGVVIPVDRTWGILIAGKYNFLFTKETVFSGTQLEKEIQNGYWGIQVGVAWQSY